MELVFSLALIIIYMCLGVAYIVSSRKQRGLWNCKSHVTPFDPIPSPEEYRRIQKELAHQTTHTLNTGGRYR